MDHIIQIANQVIGSFAAIWPYLLITIPLAVAVQVSGMSKHIRNIFNKQPLVSIVLATVVGAFSPFCSCGVVPLIASLLIGGVPLAPVMSFWIASPSMDPELVPLSIATIGWNLSLWRLGASLVISLLAGFVTHFAIARGYLGENLLRHKSRKNNAHSSTRNATGCCNEGNPQMQVIPLVANGSSRMNMPQNGAAKRIITAPDRQDIQLAEPVETNVAGKTHVALRHLGTQKKTAGGEKATCCSTLEKPPVTSANPNGAADDSKSSCCSTQVTEATLWSRIWVETRNATWLIVKFMSLAFVATALIKTWIPQDALHGFLHMDGYMSVLVATLVGIPTYTSNMLALPLVGEFLAMGMNPGAALAFLLAGPVTTLPAMIAVWGIASRRVFLLYISFSVLGAVMAGVLMNLVS